MPSTPPRRSRRPQRGDDSSLPVIPIFIAVIVLGFVIGAGFSFLGHRSDPVAVATQSPRPTEQEATDPPVVLVTPAPTEKPTPEPTDEPTEKPTATPKPTPTPKPTKPPAAVADVSAEPTSADESASPDAQASPVATESASARATPLAAARPVPAVSQPSDSGDPSFVRLSSDVVKQYLLAVAHGDDAAAYAALGASPGDRGANLTEAGVVDTKTRFGRSDAQPVANGNVVVTVPFQTTMGAYIGTYTVHRNDTGAAVIVSHSLSKS